jgi:hypothetical protein
MGLNARSSATMILSILISPVWDSILFTSPPERQAHLNQEEGVLQSRLFCERICPGDLSL